MARRRVEVAFAKTGSNIKNFTDLRSYFLINVVTSVNSETFRIIDNLIEIRYLSPWMFILDDVTFLSFACSSALDFY